MDPGTGGGPLARAEAGRWTSCPTTSAWRRAEEMAAWWDDAARRAATRRSRAGSTSTGPPVAAGYCCRCSATSSTPDQLAVADGELHYFEHRFPLAAGSDGRHCRGSARPAALPAGQLPPRGHRPELPAILRGDDTGRTAGRGPGRLRRDAHADRALGARGRRRRPAGRSPGRVDRPDRVPAPRCGPGRAPRHGCSSRRSSRPGEELPAAWPVDGDTGYDALAEAGGVLIDPAAEPAFDLLYRELTGDGRSAREHAIEGKRFVATTILRCRGVPPGTSRGRTSRTRTAALCELLVAFPVYRAYLPDGAEHLAAALAAARSTPARPARRVRRPGRRGSPTRPTSCACGSSRRRAR